MHKKIIKTRPAGIVCVIFYFSKKCTFAKKNQAIITNKVEKGFGRLAGHIAA